MELLIHSSTDFLLFLLFLIVDICIYFVVSYLMLLLLIFPLYYVLGYVWLLLCCNVLINLWFYIFIYRIWGQTVPRTKSSKLCNWNYSEFVQSKRLFSVSQYLSTVKFFSWEVHVLVDSLYCGTFYGFLIISNETSLK